MTLFGRVGAMGSYDAFCCPARTELLLWLDLGLGCYNIGNHAVILEDKLFAKWSRYYTFSSFYIQYGKTVTNS